MPGTDQQDSSHSPTAQHDPPAYTVKSFCEIHHIARSYFYTLLKEGQGPDIYKLGRRTYVSGKAAAEWRRRMEARTQGSE
jgi:hypothetical protein